MDIEALKTFMVLANTKNYTRAASQLFVAQSTVTNRIIEIEKELGISLFRRTNRKVELTREGEKFRIYARKVIELTEASLAEISSSTRFDNHLRIGSADSIYEGHLAPIILKYQRENPRDSLKISIGLSGNLLEQLQDRERGRREVLFLPEVRICAVKRGMKEMLLILIAALVLGSMLFRRRTLLEGTTDVIEPANKVVKATVDGKPVYSYVMAHKDKK